MPSCQVFFRTFRCNSLLRRQVCLQALHLKVIETLGMGSHFCLFFCLFQITLIVSFCCTFSNICDSVRRCHMHIVIAGNKIRRRRSIFCFLVRKMLLEVTICFLNVLSLWNMSYSSMTTNC